MAKIDADVNTTENDDTKTRQQRLKQQQQQQQQNLIVSKIVDEISIICVLVPDWIQGYLHLGYYLNLLYEINNNNNNNNNNDKNKEKEEIFKNGQKICKQILKKGNRIDMVLSFETQFFRHL